MSLSEESRRRWHSGPEFTAPDDQRCEALVPGHPSWYQEYTRHNHRCHKTAQQSRGGMVVCHVHARAREVTHYRSIAGRSRL